MENIDEPGFLRLADGIIRWCDPQLLEHIKETESRYTYNELRDYEQIKITSKATWRRVSGYWAEVHGYSELNRAWEELELDLKQRLEAGELHLEGIEFGQNLEREPEAIRGALAANMTFDFVRSTVRLAEKQYVSVRVSTRPSAWAPIEFGTIQLTKLPAKLSIRDLTTDQIAELIEEHGRRVVTDPHAKLMAPGKVSLIPLVQMKMRERAARGEINPNIGAEAAWLAAWIAGKTEHWDLPKAATIEKTLRKVYAELTGRSNAAT